MNESADEFPEWLPKSVHHCVFDCLKCQISCPMNKNYVDNIDGSVRFDTAETNMLLSGIPMDTSSGDFSRKVKYLGLDQWPAGIRKNLKILFELSDESE